MAQGDLGYLDRALERALVRDGLYRIEYKGICAGFVLHKGRVVRAAPVLRRSIAFWRTIAVRVGP